MVAWTDYKAVARDRGALAFEVFVAESTPQKSPEEVKAVLPDHLAYVKGLETSGKLMLAGPLSDDSGEEMQGAGMLVFRAASIEEARELAENDPMHKSEARTFRLRKWLINEGSLSITAGLSSGHIVIS